MPNLPFSPLLQKVISDLNEKTEVLQRSNNVFDLLSAILKNDKKTCAALSGFQIDTKSLSEKLEVDLPQILPQAFEEPKAGSEFSMVVEEAKNSASSLEYGFVDVEHVVAALFNSSPSIRSLFGIWEMPVDEISDMFNSLATFENSEPLSQELDENLLDQLDSEFPNLLRFCKNINSEIYNKEIKIIAREKEINKCFDVISQKKRNNVLIMGEVGIGRKSLVYGMAQKIIEGDVATYFEDHTIFELDLGAITAGASMVGSLEARFKALHEEINRFENIILLVNNVQTSFGAGNKEGSLDAANLLKPIISDPSIPTVAIIAPKDYKKYIEKDAGFVDLFEILRVEEPDTKENLEIIKSVASSLEEYHNVKFSEDAITTSIDLCERFVSYRKFPAKAIDLLDFIGAKINNERFKIPENVKKSVEKLEQKAISMMEKFGDTEDVPKDIERKVNAVVASIGKQYEKLGKKMSRRSNVSADDILEPFAEKYKITENQLRQAKASSLDEISAKLKESIFGQDSAIDKVIDVLRCSKVGLRDSTKPLGRFLFVGETSVGKSMLAKLLAEYYFGDSSACLKLDMSEFQDKYSASGLIGTTAGYIGYENGGRLTEFVKNRPNSVVLFDEAEKSNPDILNLLLQIMEDGHLTDGHGDKIDFTNCIVILTSNAGAGKQKVSAGFHNQVSDSEHFHKALREFFKPEFLARLDDVVAFNTISDQDMEKIIDSELNKRRKKLLDLQSLSVHIDTTVRDFILKQAKQDKTHARKIQGIIRREIEIPLSKFIIENQGKKKVELKYNQKLEIL